MIDLVTYVIILLIISAVAMTFIVRVLIKQVRLFKYPIKDSSIRRFRHVLFAISLTIIIMGLIPVGINIFSLFHQTGRPAEIGLVSLVYSLGVHLQTLFLSYLLWRIYSLANNNFNDKDQ